MRLALVLAVLPLAACGARGPARWQALLDELVAAEKVPGGVLTVSTPDEVWSGASGFRGPDTTLTFNPDARMPIGSLTKLFTATVVLQLVEEDAVGLDQPISRWFPDVPDATEITIENLLQHRSGLGDYLSNPDVAASWGEPWTPIELLDAALAVERLGEPGGDVAYSNTNYLILGLIIEELDGVDWEESVRNRILTPLALDATAFAGEDGALDGVRPGELAEFEGEGFVMDPSITWAAGGLVSSAIDVDRFGRALFIDKALVDGATLSTMTNGAPYSSWPLHTATYGYGTLIVEETLGRTTVGHMGGVPGFTSRLLVDRDAEIAATLIVNRDGVDTFPTCEKALDATPAN